MNEKISNQNKEYMVLGQYTTVYQMEILPLERWIDNLGVSCLISYRIVK